MPKIKFLCITWLFAGSNIKAAMEMNPSRKGAVAAAKNQGVFVRLERIDQGSKPIMRAVALWHKTIASRK
jgi:hypothetical protein